MEINFIIRMLLQTFILFLVAYGGGKLVASYNVKTNYTRKMNHFALFFIPMLSYKLFFHGNTQITYMIEALFALAYIAIYVKPLRTRVPVFALAFKSFDRPEDRPYTFTWIIVQLISGWSVMIPLSFYFISINKPDLMFIPVLINSFGDGLAEPVGVRFGKYKYNTYALFTKKKYQRSIEGSLCVFIASVIVLIAFKGLFSTEQFIVALICMPILMTLAEAFAPHTCDTPVIFLTAGFSIFLILLI